MSNTSATPLSPALSKQTFYYPNDQHGSLQAAADALQPGDRLVIKPGVYRESLAIGTSGTEANPIVIEAETAGTVRITGTDVVEGWSETAPGSGIWKVLIDLSHIPDAPKYGILAGRREQVFVDGVALRQVLHRDQIVGGTFYYDATAKELYMQPQPFTGELSGGKQAIDAGGITGGGTVTLDRDAPENCWQFLIQPFDPSAHLIEVTQRESIFATVGEHTGEGVAYVEVRGLSFYGSADLPQQSMARIGGSHILVEDCLFEGGAARGFDLRTQYSTVRRCVTRLNGQMGFAGYGTGNVVEDCALLYNNTKHADFTCFEQGGSKICRTDGWTVRRIRCVGNDGPGIWFDIDNTNAIIEQCWCEGNSGPGIMYEISSDAVIRNNVCVRNGFAYHKDVRFDSIFNSVGHFEPVYGQGILVQMSRRVVVHNNTCVDNRRCGIELRHHPYQQAGNPGHSPNTYRSEEVQCFNNIMADNAWDNLMVSTAPENPSKSDEVRNNEYDHNLFFSRKALLQYGGNLHAFCRWGKTQRSGSMSLEEWRATTHQDLHSIQWDPMFVAPDELDFRIEASSPAAANSRAIPGFTTDYSGQARDESNPGIGAFAAAPTSAAALLSTSR
ncbi:MAG: hypothetical protein EA353_00825 [Puniceicoccaceae bacterium]|nr:MAG: hypothetical protein EA353_00825 [Puniceicoccaceae bacterium]